MFPAEKVKMYKGDKVYRLRKKDVKFYEKYWMLQYTYSPTNSNNKIIYMNTPFDSVVSQKYIGHN